MKYVSAETGWRAVTHGPVEEKLQALSIVMWAVEETEGFPDVYTPVVLMPDSKTLAKIAPVELVGIAAPGQSLARWEKR